MPTSFLAPLPGNGSNTRFRVSQPYDYPSYPMEFSPSYPVVPSSEYLEPPPSCLPILSDGYEIHPSLVAMVRAQSFSGRKDECPYPHSTHPTVEAIPVLSHGRSKNLVQPDCKRSWRRLDKTEGRVLLVLLPYLQGDCSSKSTDDISKVMSHLEWRGLDSCI